MSIENSQHITEDFWLKALLSKEAATIATTLLEFFPGYIYLKNKRSEYIACNTNLAKLANLNHPSDIFGLKDEALPWGHWQTEDFVNTDQKILTTGHKDTSINKLPIKRVDGHYLYVKTEKIPIIDHNGIVQGILGVSLDITDDKLIEQNIIKQKQENIIANMPGYIYWKNKDSVYIGCNNNLAKVSGLNNRSEIIGKTDYDFDWGKEKAAEFIQADQEVIRDKIVKITENKMPVKRPDGNYYYVRTEKIPLYENGKITGVLAVAVDITDQKLLEEDLKKEKENSDRLKTEFVRNMEHDIRTPFTGIWSMAEFLWKQESDATKKEYLEIITHCAKELLDYCNGILDFSRIESGKQLITEQKITLRKLLEEIQKIEEPAVEMKNLEFFCDYDNNLPEVLIADQYRLYRILLNLTGNAIKFTSEGQVSLSFKLKKKNEKTAIVDFIISDTGIGIPEEKHIFIYEKFSRLNPSNQRIYTGLGNGLRIVKQFIHEMEGEIKIQSQVNKGTTFICTIPFKLPL